MIIGVVVRRSQKSHVNVHTSLTPHFSLFPSPSTVARFVAEDIAPAQVQLRYNRVLNPALIKSEWTTEEDERLVRAVQGYGTKNWIQVALALPGRTNDQCRERYNDFERKRCVSSTQRQGSEERGGEEDPKAAAQPTTLRKEKGDEKRKREGKKTDVQWTDEMDKRLLDVVERIGTKSWLNVAREVDQLILGKQVIICIIFRFWGQTFDRSYSVALVIMPFEKEKWQLGQQKSASVMLLSPVHLLNCRILAKSQC